MQVLIFPYNGNGLEALSCLSKEHQFIGFIDDTKEKQGIDTQGFKVYDRSILDMFPDAKVLAVPGSPSSYLERNKIIDSLNIPSERFLNVIHPKASVSPLASMGKNVLLMAGVVLTANCKIGDHVCILPNTVIHHDTTVHDYSLIGSNVVIAGNVRIGKNTYIGSGTSIINNISVGENALIGIGSNVIKSIKSNTKVVGNPAKQI